MSEYRFAPSELRELALVFTEKRESRFVMAFTDCVKKLLYVKMLRNGGSKESSNWELDWYLLLEMIDFEPDYEMRDELSEKLGVSKLYRKGGMKIWHRMRPCEDDGTTYTFQEIFSAAIAQYVIEGWGDGEIFRRLIN